MSVELTNGTSINVPKGDGSGVILLDLAPIAKAESRLMEVAIVNRETAPELLATYNAIWLKLNRSVGQLQAEKDKAEDSFKRAKADAKLKCTDEVLKAMGHSKASADLRESFVELDENVIAVKDRINIISVVLDILKGKQAAFYNAYKSVRDLTSRGNLPPPTFTDGNRPQAFAPEHKLPEGY